MSIFNHFTHLSLTADQQSALQKLQDFISSPTQVFMLKGYAGSGKTTIIKGLVEYFSSIEKGFLLMAPTGRAAKVIREKTGKEAFTVHKSIYSYEDLVEVKNGESFYYYYKIRNNDDVCNKIFIVDEASMLSDAKSEGEFFRFGTGHLLPDLFTFTRITTGTANTKIIFVGDPCQLPPVGDNSSKAFDAAYLKEKFGVYTEEAEMKEVKRQGGDSGILRAAAKIRKSISSGFFNDFNLSGNGTDIFNPSYESFLNTWEEADPTKIIVTYKNKTALELNLQIRERKFGDGNLPVQKGDIVIMGGNNYRKGIFNGEFAVVNEAGPIPESRTIALKGQKPVTLTWRSIELVFPDAENNNKVVSGKMLENFLYGDNFLKPEEMQALYVDFCQRHEGLNPKTEEFKEAIIKDEFFNCLLLKFGYAVTCHKAQGGEWDNVFTVWDHDNTIGFNCFHDGQTKRGKDNEGFYRWAYTAVTRASGKLYAVNPPRFDSYTTMTFSDEVVLTALAALTGTPCQAEEIALDKELLEELAQHQLLEQPVQLQDHFIRVRQAVRKQFIDITGWKRSGFEVCYRFGRNGQQAAFKTWFNGDLQFKKPFMLQPIAGSDAAMAGGLATLLAQLPGLSITRNTAETIISQIEFDLETEEKFPFTRNLYDSLTRLLADTGIVFDNPAHQQNKERYTFQRGAVTAVLDFYYDDNGFWKKVIPDAHKTNSKALLAELQKAILTLKQTEYAV